MGDGTGMSGGWDAVVSRKPKAVRADRVRTEEGAMANEFDEGNAGGGSGFVMGLLTGTVLGAGLGMLFAPKTGTELRNQISETASTAGRAASDQYRKASEAASSLADKGRELYDKAKDAVGRGAEEARQYGNEAQRQAESMRGSSGTSGSTGSIGGGGGAGMPPRHTT